MGRLRRCPSKLINNAQMRSGPEVLFRDDDGDLPPNEMYLARESPDLCTNVPNDAFFMWMLQLAKVFAGFFCINIALRTSWIRWLGFRRVRYYLLSALPVRVIGATWHFAMW